MRTNQLIEAFRTFQEATDSDTAAAILTLAWVIPDADHAADRFGHELNLALKDLFSHGPVPVSVSGSDEPGTPLF